MLPVYVVSPLYTAVIGCVPTVNAEVLNVAVPPTTGLVPRGVAPSLNVTVPVGVPGPLGVTVAVKVTDCPNVDGLRLETSEVVVAI